LRRTLLFVIITLLLICTATAKEVKRDPETKLIRLLYIGAPFQASAYQAYKYDPLLSTTPVNGNLFGIPPEQVARAMRLYMPRTLERMIANYDVVGLDDTSVEAFPTQTIHWMVDGCMDGGLGFFMAGGLESFGGSGFPSWGDTVLDKIMPVECISGQYTREESRNVVVDFENDLMKNMPWDEYEQYGVFANYNPVIKKQSASQLSELVHLGLGGGRDPGWVWWDIDNGRFFASAPGFRGSSAGLRFIRWKHYPDFVSNLVYYCSGLTPPSDINLLHAVRRSLKDVDDQRQVIIGTINFISVFGADTRDVELELMEAEARLGDARREFVELNLEEARAISDAVFEMLQGAFELAIKAKEAALFWIFITEWLVVSATSLLTGFLVWTLMVRRRLYREVKVTRGT
jgi:uncharacterized membrane protein